MKQLPLTQNKFVLVDDEDFEFLNQWKWYFDKKTGYARRTHWVWKEKKSYSVKLHRVIIKAKEGELWDHKDGNKLNCQKSNLRKATPSQNSLNKKIQSNNTSGARGVCLWKKRYKNGTYYIRWRVRITINKKRINIGHFINKQDAIKAYNKAVIKLSNGFGRINYVK